MNTNTVNLSGKELNVKKRVFYLDFIRALSTIVIVMTHYNAMYIYMGNEIALQKVVITGEIANIYIGNFGVSLFLIISGAALMLSNENNWSIKKFFQKRFFNIYPMFWMAYLFAFLYHFYILKGINQTIPKQRILLSLFGMDGYLGQTFPTFYLVGEWFLGFIILFYVVFPVLRWGVLKHPIITALIALGLYAFLMVFYNADYPKSIFFPIRLPEVLFGMYYQKYFKKTKPSVAIAGLLVLIINTVTAPQIDAIFQTTYVGMAAFLFLSWLGTYAEKVHLISKISAVVSKYSYAIFLVHHQTIRAIASTFDLNNISILESYILFLLCSLIVALLSKLLYDFHGKVMRAIRGCYSKEQQKGEAL